VDGYLPKLPLGAVMRGVTLGVVEDSRNPAFAPGDIVQGLGGWQEYHSGEVEGWTKLPRIPGVPLTAYFGAIGHIGQGEDASGSQTVRRRRSHDYRPLL